MPYAYYAKLKSRDKAIYRKSDAVAELPIPNAESLKPLARALEVALAAEDRPTVERATRGAR